MKFVDTHIIKFFIISFFRHFFKLRFDIIIIRGDIIKKNIGIILTAIVIALIFSKAVFSSYNSEKVMESYGNVYLLQYGSYINKQVMDEMVKKLDNYVTDKIDNKYYVYLGAYYNLETARKMQKKYKEGGIHTYIKNDFFSDNNLISEIKELDNSLLNETDNKKIFEINEKILKLLKNGIS